MPASISRRPTAGPLADRALRTLLGLVLPHNGRFRLALQAARLGKPLMPMLEALGLTRLAAMLRLAPEALPPARADQGRTLYAASGPVRGRVVLMDGCVTPVIGPQVQAAAIRVLTRHGIEVVMPRRQGCCGGLDHHAGREGAALAKVRANVDAWLAEADGPGLDAILITASGCGTTVKDYGHMLRTDAAYAGKAAKVSKLTLDISEYLSRLKLVQQHSAGLTVAYHAACSLQHGQKVVRPPKELLSNLGFVVKDVPESHLCCGSAGTYNILQPELADRLRRAQSRECREGQARRDRCRQYRLYHADRGGHVDPGGPYGRTDRLGDGRARAFRAEGQAVTRRAG